MKPIILFALITIGLMTTSCFSVRPDGTSKGSRHHEVFFVGEGHYQYFIKPLDFKSDNSSAKMDITFRDYLIEGETGIVNFTITTSEPQLRVESGIIYSGENSSVLQSLEVLYTDRKDGADYVARYSSKIPVSDLPALFANSNWVLELGGKNEDYKLNPTKKSTRAIESLNELVIIPVFSGEEEESFFR